jgi:prepilin-type N-terminal cleavage/methylation domain-containing protein
MLPSSGLTRRAPRRGFTLPEILIVIVMISVLAIVAIPRFANTNAKRHMESARMRVTAALATARQAAIQKGQPVTFMIKAHRVTVSAGPDTIMTRVPLDTLYQVRVSNVTDPYTIEFSSRGFARLSSSATIVLKRNGVSDESVVVTTTGMVQR